MNNYILIKDGKSALASVDDESLVELWTSLGYEVIQDSPTSKIYMFKDGRHGIGKKLPTGASWISGKKDHEHVPNGKGGWKK